MRVFILLIVLLSGCVSNEYVIEKYVCPDAWVVDEPSECAGHGLECSRPQCPKCTCESDKVDLVGQADVGECGAIGCPNDSLYVASKNSKLFHTCGCSHVGRINPDNLLCFESLEKAKETGRDFSGC